MFLAHVEYMDKLFQDEENKFVDSNTGKAWLVLTGPTDSQQERTRRYLLDLMSKTGREYELMRSRISTYCLILYDSYL